MRLTKLLLAAVFGVFALSAVAADKWKLVGKPVKAVYQISDLHNPKNNGTQTWILERWQHKQTKEILRQLILHDKRNNVFQVDFRTAWTREEHSVDGPRYIKKGFSAMLATREPGESAIGYAELRLVEGDKEKILAAWPVTVEVSLVGQMRLVKFTEYLPEGNVSVLEQYFYKKATDIDFPQRETYKVYLDSERKETKVSVACVRKD